MRFTLGFVAASFVAGGPVACGGTATDANDETPLANGCPSSVVGTWQGTTQQDELRLAGDGAFRYRGFDGCDNAGTFACPESNLSPGTMQVSVTDSTGGYCLTEGTHSCQVSLNGNTMAYDCSGEGNLHYQRR